MDIHNSNMAFMESRFQKYTQIHGYYNAMFIQAINISKQNAKSVRNIAYSGLKHK